MAFTESIRHMDDLPDEGFAQILDLVPIRDIFVLMRVSKRWAAACRFVVRTRMSLSIGKYDLYRYCAGKMRGWDWHRNRPSDPLDKITLVNNSLIPAMMKSLNQMENIRQLCVYGVASEVMSPFVRKFADQLTLLEVSFAISDVSADVFPHLTQLLCRHFDTKTAAAFPKLAELIIYADRNEKTTPDMMLPSLKKLVIAGYPYDQQTKRFILANATNLVSLSVNRLEVGFNHAVVFKNMTELHCGMMDDNMVEALPGIRRLTIWRSMTAAFLKRLPAVQSLNIVLDFRIQDEETNVNEVKACAAVIAGMRNLKELTINAYFDPSSNRTRFAFSSMFDDLPQLKKICISVAADGRAMVNGDKIMCSLVQQSATLCHVFFCGINFTAAAYASLAQLQNLSDLTLYKGNAPHGDQNITTEAVLNLLRGSGRKAIRRLKVWNTGLDVSQITREVELMAQERGTTFAKFDHSGHLVYKVYI